MNLLKANRYQLLCAHNELIGRPPPIEAYNEYITTTKDKVSFLLNKLIGSESFEVVIEGMSTH